MKLMNQSWWWRPWGGSRVKKLGLEELLEFVGLVLLLLDDGDKG